MFSFNRLRGPRNDQRIERDYTRISNSKWQLRSLALNLNLLSEGEPFTSQFVFCPQSWMKEGFEYGLAGCLDYTLIESLSRNELPFAVEYPVNR